jgi:hypothetical protein
MHVFLKIAPPLLILLVVAIFSPAPAEAGISLGSGGITLGSGQSTEFCDVWIYAVQDGGKYTVETTGDLKPLTTSITPSDFTLVPIDCPQEEKARRACITENCLSGDQSSCKVVCVKFTAPVIYGLSPEKMTYSGAILNSIKIGAATIKEPYEFSVVVMPGDAKPIIIAGIVGVAVVCVVAYMMLRKRSGKKKK